MLPLTIRILIVDDADSARERLAADLNELGYHNIEYASNGADGVAMVKAAYDTNKPYHLVFLDWVMPRMEGIDALKKLRHDIRTAATHIVMITSEGQRDKVVRAAREGIDAYILKTYSIDDLKLVMKNLAQKAASTSK